MAAPSVIPSQPVPSTSKDTCTVTASFPPISSAPIGTTLRRKLWINGFLVMSSLNANKWVIDDDSRSEDKLDDEADFSFTDIDKQNDQYCGQLPLKIIPSRDIVVCTQASDSCSFNVNALVVTTKKMPKTIPETRTLLVLACTAPSPEDAQGIFITCCATKT